MTNDLNETRDYYNSLAEDISNNYPQGYQVALIKNTSYSDLSLVEQHYKYLMSLVPMNTYDWIIDLGCGNGQFFDYLQSNYDYMYMNYFGIDISDEQIKIADPKSESKPGSFACNSFENFVTLDPEYHHCFFLESIGYVTNLDLIVKTANFILHDGGYVIIKNPMKIITDEKADKLYSKKMSSIAKEYGFTEKSLGMIVDKKVLEDAFLSNGFELYKFETPEIDIETYNETFCKVKKFSKSHPKYVKHVTGKKRIEYNSNQNKYFECGVLVFKKVESVIEDFSQLPQINPSYTAGVEQSRIDPSHPNAPYMKRSNQISYGIDMKQPSESDSESQTTSINSSEVATTSEENPMNIRLDITYENE